MHRTFEVVIGAAMRKRADANDTSVIGRVALPVAFDGAHEALFDADAIAN